MNGFANGWLVRPERAGTMQISLRWTPQRFVWIGFAASALAVARVPRARGGGPAIGAGTNEPADDLAEPPRLTSPFAALGSSPSTAALVALALGAGVVTSLFSRPWIGVIVGLACLVAARVSGARIVFTAGAPLALALARITRFDDLAWLAVALLVADLATEWVRARSATSNDGRGDTRFVVTVCVRWRAAYVRPGRSTSACGPSTR